MDMGLNNAARAVANGELLTAYKAVSFAPFRPASPLRSISPAWRKHRAALLSGCAIITVAAGLTFEPRPANSFSFVCGGSTAGAEPQNGGGSTAGNNAVACGIFNTAGGDNSTAVGSSSSAGGLNGTATGFAAKASGDSSSAYGDKSGASGIGSSAYGNRSSAVGSQSSAYGFFSGAGGDNSSAYGSDSDASALASSAFGNKSTASGVGSSAYGSLARRAATKPQPMGLVLARPLSLARLSGSAARPAVSTVPPPGS